MTKLKLRKEFMFKFSNIISSITHRMFYANPDYLEKCFEDLYTNISNVFKLNKIKDAYIITDSIKENEISLNCDCHISISINSEDDNYNPLSLISFKYSMHFIKVKEYLYGFVNPLTSTITKYENEYWNEDTIKEERKWFTINNTPNTDNK